MPPPPCPPPRPDHHQRMNATPWGDDLEAIPLPEKGRASLCCSVSWVFEAILLASLLPTPNHKGIEILFFFLIFIYLAVPGPSFGTQDLHCSMWESVFSCDMWDLGLLPGIEPWPLALGAWSLSHWTTREVLGIFVKMKYIKKNPMYWLEIKRFLF